VFSCRWFKDHLLLVSTYQTGACVSFHKVQLGLLQWTALELLPVSFCERIKAGSVAVLVPGVEAAALWCMIQLAAASSLTTGRLTGRGSMIV
jgi:hypothetical protein